MPKRNKNGGALGHPRSLAPDLRLTKTFRFQTTRAVSTAITAQNLLQLMVVATSGITSTRIFQSVRLIKVEVWTIAALGGTSEVVQVTGVGDGPTNVVSDMSMGVSPAHVVWRPRPNSLSALWLNAGVREADNLFLLACPGTSVVDVTLEVIVKNDFFASPGAGPVPAGAATGSIYLCTLDGNGLTGKCTPEDYLLLP